VGVAGNSDRANQINQAAIIRLHPHLRRAAYWALLPLIVPQGLMLRRNAPRFPPAAGPHAGRVGSGKSLKLLAIGDSIIAGVGAPTVGQALPGQVAKALTRRLGREIHWHATGRIGLDAREVKRDLLPSIPQHAFDAMVVSVGVNDVTSLKHSWRWRAELTALLDALQAHSPHAVIALMGVPPLGSFPLLRPPLRTVLGLRATMFDAIASEIAAPRERVVHIALDMDARPEKFSADGYHPSAESYAELGEHVTQAMVARIFAIEALDSHAPIGSNGTKATRP
jgi:lysophospholipase L1-like esterase